MKRINFNIKDRKLLYGVLSIVLVCIFSLSIAYAALSAVLTINGNAEVVSSTWDVYLANVHVKDGSVDGGLPSIVNSTTASFSTTLSKPGDYYEFFIDVVNNVVRFKDTEKYGTQAVATITDNKFKLEKVLGYPHARNDVFYAIGKVDEIKDFMFIVTDDNKVSYAFSFEEKPQGLDKIAVGDMVIVTYTGTISEVDPFMGEILSVEKK